MVYIKKNESSQKQMEYARLRWATKKDKKTCAIAAGYNGKILDNVKQKIEDKPGYDNAIARIARDSNALALTIMDEFKRRGVEEFSNKDLIGALNAIGAAWQRFNSPPKIERSRLPDYDNGKNPLRTLVLQQNNVIHEVEATPTKEEVPIVEKLKEDPMDF